MSRIAAETAYEPFLGDYFLRQQPEEEEDEEDEEDNGKKQDEENEEDDRGYSVNHHP